MMINNIKMVLYMNSADWKSSSTTSEAYGRLTKFEDITWQSGTRINTNNDMFLTWRKIAIITKD